MFAARSENAMIILKSYAKKGLFPSLSWGLRTYSQEYAFMYVNYKGTYGFSEGIRTFRFWPGQNFFKIERFSANTVKNVENSVFAEI